MLQYYVLAFNLLHPIISCNCQTNWQIGIRGFVAQKNVLSSFLSSDTNLMPGTCLALHS